MKVLVIYELVPEETKVYLLDVEGKDLAKVKKAHGVYANNVGNDKPAVWLSEFLEGKPELKVEKGKPFDATEVELVVHSGFIL
jgi:hypothetical protein